MRSEADIIRNLIYIQERAKLNRIHAELRKRKEVKSIVVEKGGLIEGHILDDRIFVEMVIHTEYGSAFIPNVLIDTGSNITSVCTRFLCGMEATGEALHAISAHTSASCYLLTCELQIDKKITINPIEIMVADLDCFVDTGIDAVIGMDIIQAGNLHIWNKDGLPYFTFEM